jgi:antitoxin MazE
MYILEAVMQVAKWGNSLAVRLPKTVVEALELKEGDDIEIRVLDARELAMSRKPDRMQILERLRELRGSLPADWKFDRDEANAR